MPSSCSRKRHNERKFVILFSLREIGKTIDQILLAPDNIGLDARTLRVHLVRLRKFGLVEKKGKEYLLTDYGKKILKKLEYLRARGMPLNLKKCVDIKVYKSGKVYRVHRPVFKVRT
jgi:predicted transcriptional regulator